MHTTCILQIWWCTSEWSYFHWRVCQENMGNHLETRLTQNIEGFLPRSRLVRGILIKFSPLLPLNRKSSSLWRTLRLTRKAILIKKSEIYEANATALTYIFTRSQSATACICSAKAMTRMTRIYSVAFPLAYDFARNYFSD